MILTDDLGRRVSYLRLSVTDRCNLRCFYCRSTTDFRLAKHGEILSYEELRRVVGVAASLGVGKVRLTGGEPFARRGFVDFLAGLAETWPGLDLRLTTNGTLFGGQAGRLMELGLGGLNVSLDSLRPERFAEITGRDEFAAVMRGIDECQAAGLRVKLNAVALKGINSGELGDFLRLAVERAIDVRFIEFMPIGGDTSWRTDYFWPAEEILAQAEKLVELTPEENTRPEAGPARLWRINGTGGRLGIISALSNHFCARCNRLRLTSEGKLRTCLFSDKEYDLKGMLRNPKISDEVLRRTIIQAQKSKPLGYEVLREAKLVKGRIMSAIGG